MASTRQQYPQDLRTVFGVSVMGLAHVIATGFISGYLMLYITDYAGIYTGVAGKAASVATIMLLIGRIWDGLNSPLLGFVMDRSKRTRIGKFKPYMLGGTIASVILVIALFNIPSSLTDVLKVAWLYVFYILFDIAFTFMPINPMIQSLSKDAEVRAKLLVAPRIVTLIFSSLLSLFMVIAIALGPDGITPNIGLAVILFILPAAAIALLGISLVKEGTSSVEEEVVRFKDVLTMLKVNKPLLVSLISQLFSGFVFILVQATLMYYLKYAFGAENLGKMSILTGTVMIASILLATFLSKYLIRIFSPGVLMILAYTASAIPLLILWVINLAGPITSKGLLIPLLAGFFLANSFAFLPTNVISMECMDYNKFKMGKSMQGMINALGQFISKIQSALGAAVVGAILIGVGYDAALFQDASTIPAKLFNGLGLANFAIPALFSLVAALVMVFYPLLKRSQRDQVYAQIAQMEQEVENNSGTDPGARNGTLEEK